MPEATASQGTVHERPVELLQNLIRFDTTNPPGNEASCIGYIAELLSDYGFETTLLAKNPERPNLITRLKGRGDAPPLLLYGHVDVVTTSNQQWTHPPFAGIVADDYVWGRGALDMKGGVAMMLAALLRAKAEAFVPAGDIMLAVLSDEEAGGGFGAMFLVEEHPDVFRGIRYAIGEFGGFSFYVGGKRFYPIQVAEKRMCWTKVMLRGPAGHGALPMRGGAMAKLGRVLTHLDRRRLPVHVTPTAHQALSTMADALPYPMSALLRGLLNPRLTDRLLDMAGPRLALFDPILHNTVNATMVRGGEQVNVIPGEVELHLDGRLLPGFTPENLVAEVQTIIGRVAELEVLRHDPGPAEPDMGFFGTLAAILREADPGGVPVPMLLPAVTDARFFTRLGIQTYGFLPMKLPEDFAFSRSIHAADERIPVEAVTFGARAIFEALKRYKM